MGLMSKLKNILFEEEEVEIPVIEKKETEKKELPKNNEHFAFYSSSKEEEKVETKELPKKDIEEVSEREIFKSERTFNFPAFDEEEFDRVSKPTSVPKNNNVLSREKYNKPKVEIPRKEEPVKKFKPSPIISPVYGILDKNYTPEEITSRSDSRSQRLDIEDVRKKAFGEPKEEVKEEVLIPEEPAEDNKILEEKLEKMRTIDELLNDSSDEIISLDELDQKTKEEEDVPEVIDDEPLNNLDKEDLEESENESDLFDLIDSMYENREEE